MKPEDELKPCPFCGGEAVRLPFLDSQMLGMRQPKKSTRYVGCRRRCVVSFANVTEAECRAAWNRRAGK